MVTARDVSALELIRKLKEELKKSKEINPPVWAKFSKSGIHRERPPQQPDFWYVRAASILRRIYLDGPVGVQRLRTYYGGLKKRGYKPSRFRRAGGAMIRKMLQQLETAGFIDKVDKGGRKITSKGKKLLDSVAYEVSKT